MRSVLRAITALVFLAPMPSWGGGLPTGVGDTLDVSVFGFPDLHKKAVVEDDGTFSYFMLGELQVAGLTAEQLRKRIGERLVSEGLVRDPKVSVEIAARQPVYVMGDVMRPGGEPYAPQLTVRSARALAGGLDPFGLRSSTKGPNNVWEIRAEYQTLGIDVIRARAHVKALAAELAGQSTFALDSPQDMIVPPDLITNIVALETRQLRQRLAQSSSQRTYLKRSVEQAKRQIAALADRRKAAEDGVQQGQDTISRFKSFVDRGLIVQERLLEAQRGLLPLRNSLYESISAAAQAVQGLIDAEHKLEAFDKERELANLKDSQDAVVAEGAATARLDALRGKMGVKPLATRPTFVIYRQRNGRGQHFIADAGSEILPGDILDVGYGTSPVAVADREHTTSPRQVE